MFSHPSGSPQLLELLDPAGSRRLKAAMSNNSSSEDAGKPRIAIIGAGVGGLSLGIALKQELKYDNFTIYERTSQIGGTWRDNTYPGCACDIPGHFYSSSYELNPNWTQLYAGQAEILEYWLGICKKRDLYSKIVFETEMISAEWDASAQRYTLGIKNMKTGEKSEVHAEILVSAIGGFMAPVYPKDIPGTEAFQGLTWHSLYWRHDVNLTGKKVGVIGNGCSAAQIVPEISKDLSVQVVNFCRTPQWYEERHQYNYSSWAKWIFAYVPGVMRLYRNYLLYSTEISYLVFRNKDSFISKLARKEFTSYIKKTAPEKYHEKLIPDFPPGCKRIIVDPGYLACLHQDNVDLCWDSIDEIVKEGIKLKSGEVIPLDIIIFATGFSVDSLTYSLRGRDGLRLDEYFATQGGATGYHGSVYPHYPNFFTITGPNIATGHTSLLYSEEIQTHYILKMVKPIIDGKMKSFEVKPEVTKKYNDWLQKKLVKTVWSTCSSYYRVAHTGKNIALFPGTVTQQRWIFEKVNWGNYYLTKKELP